MLEQLVHGYTPGDVRGRRRHCLTVPQFDCGGSKNAATLKTKSRLWLITGHPKVPLVRVLVHGA